ncbi:MAG: SulP family inorganic anion transporter [Caldilineaceae bacterium]
MQHLSLFALWQRELAGYNIDKFRQDLLAGLTVGAVALPLALAFGVASGSTAAAGLVTAVLAGIIIGALSGAPYQISGPTGAMSAILILLSQKYGIQGVWLAGAISGLFLLLLGLFRLGRFIAFIPAPVITGFTSGIAVIIFTGQINNLFGSKSPELHWGLLQGLSTIIEHDSTLIRLLSYLQFNYAVDWKSIVVGLLVVATMIFWPSKWGKFFPGSLAGIIIATILTWIAGFNIALIGDIPRTILLEDRLRLSQINLSQISGLFAPILSITALGAVESLLCGAVASKMTGIRLQANTELIAQGIGNMIIPFFGGVPATAAIARTSVGIKSGGHTRLVSIIHALVLLLSALILAPVIGRIPLTALAGVLMVTSWRMNEWHAIHFMFGRRFKSGIAAYIITLLATISLDLTQAIIIGAVLSSVVFINQMASLQIDIDKIDSSKLKKRGITLKSPMKGVRIAYLTGPIFFAATSQFNEAFAQHDDGLHTLILSMRAVPLIDLSGVEVLRSLHEEMAKVGRTLMLCGVHSKVMKMIERAGLDAEIGKENFFWGADQAIIEADKRNSKHATESEPSWNGSTALALYRPAHSGKEKAGKKRK